MSGNLAFYKHRAEINRQFYKYWRPHDGQIPVIRDMTIDFVQRVFLKCGRKYAKALCLDTPVLTVDGFKRNGDIVAGDIVYDEKGNEQTVLVAHDIIHEPESYRIHFKNGEHIDACADHLWFTSSKVERKSFSRFPEAGRNGSVRNTSEIFDTQLHGKEYNHKIKCQEPIKFIQNNLVIDPYILGLWLGDGHTHYPKFSTADAELLDAFVDAGYEYTHYDHYDYGIGGGFIDDLNYYGLIKNKHIPECYLRSSFDDRLALVQGLMDSDGTINSRGNYASFCTTLTNLADDFHYLVSSLGMIATTHMRESWLNGKRCKDHYDVGFIPYENIFRLKRKLDKINVKNIKDRSHTIVKVEKIESKPMRCLTVTGDSSLYLVSKSLIPTHNTESAIAVAYLLALYFPKSQIYYIAPTLKHGGELVWHNSRLPGFFRTCMQYPWESDREYAERKLYGEGLHKKFIAKTNSSEMRVIFNNNSWIKVEGSENYDNANGMNPHFIIYDEFKAHEPKFHEAMEPNLTTHRAPILIVGTPPEGTDSYYSRIEHDFKTDPKAKFYCMPSYVNNLVYPKGEQDPLFQEIKERYERRGETDVFEREYLAKTVKGGHRAIFPMFKSPEIDYNTGKMKNFTEHVISYDSAISRVKQSYKDWDYFASYDAGTVVCFAMLFGVVNKYSKEIIILDEVYEKDQKKTSVKVIYPRALKIMESICRDDRRWIEVYDNAAAWFCTEVASEFDRGILPCTKDIKNKESRLSMIKDAMLLNYFKCTEKCTGLIHEIDNYYKDDKGRIPKENDHAIDSLRYLLNAASYDSVPSEPFVEQDRRFYLLEDENRVSSSIIDDGYDELLSEFYE